MSNIRAELIVQSLLHFVSAILSGVCWVGEREGKGRGGDIGLGVGSILTLFISCCSFCKSFFFLPPSLSPNFSKDNEVSALFLFFFLFFLGVFGWTTFCCPIPQKKKKKKKEKHMAPQNTTEVPSVWSISISLSFASISSSSLRPPSFFIMILW